METKFLIKLPSYNLWAVVLFFICLTGACQNGQNQKQKREIPDMTEILNVNLKAKDFEVDIDGQKTGLYWLHNDSMIVALTNYGARIVGLWVPDQAGQWTDVVVGMGNIQDYAGSSEPYFGATIGRVGNRIAKGRFLLDGKEYEIPLNNGENALHGGIEGFESKVWAAEQPDDQTLVLHYVSADGEEGFPGELDVIVTYSLTESRGLRIEYDAITDQPTVVNLTNHAFFNLNGEGSGDVLDHEVIFHADRFTPVDEGLIPTGELREVKGTPFDFTTPHTIGARIDAEDEQLRNGGGYDHNFVIKDSKSDEMLHAASVTGDQSGIVMDVYTEEPGMQFYTGNFMQGKNTFKSGAKDEYRTAFCIETQHFPDSPNHSDFPSIRLDPGEKYHTVTVYRFDTRKETEEL